MTEVEQIARIVMDRLDLSRGLKRDMELEGDFRNVATAIYAEVVKPLVERCEWLREDIAELERRVAEDDARWSQITIRAAQEPQG